MRPDEQRIDADARLNLPTSFANSVEEDRIRFFEEFVKPLGDVDRDYFLKVLEKLSMPSKALIQAAQRHTVRRG